MIKQYSKNKNLIMPKAILFDTDNTLYPYDPAHSIAQKAVKKKVVDTFSITSLDFDKAFFTLLEEPSSPVPPELEVDKQWDLVALINGNFGAIMENPEPTEAFREVMHLCSPSGYSQAANAIWDLNIKRSIAPVTIDNKVLLASGADIEVVLDIEALPYPAGIFAYILNDFFSAFLSYDRFIQLTVRSRGNDKPLICFDRRHGSQDCV